jgi:hypothetical protein
MKDTCFAADPIERIEVIDHIELGRRIAGWALDPRSRPRSLSDLRSQLAGIAEVPETIESFSFHDEVPEHLTIRLPDPEAILLRCDRLEDPILPLDYGLPPFYSDHFNVGRAPVLTPLDMFHARIADRCLSHLP